MEISKSIDIAASALTAQSERLKVISQNIANADSGATEVGGDPYRRKTISFKSVLDRKTGLEMVKVKKVGEDNSEFESVLDPSNPMADGSGYIKMPNVSTLIEMTDMKEARNAYQANLSVIEMAKTMVARTLELLRA